MYIYTYRYVHIHKHILYVNIYIYVHIFTNFHKSTHFRIAFEANLQRIRSVAAEMKRLPQSKQMARCNLRHCQALRVLVAKAGWCCSPVAKRCLFYSLWPSFDLLRSELVIPTSWQHQNNESKKYEDPTDLNQLPNMATTSQMWQSWNGKLANASPGYPTTVFGSRKLAAIKINGKK